MSKSLSPFMLKVLAAVQWVLSRTFPTKNIIAYCVKMSIFCLFCCWLNRKKIVAYKVLWKRKIEISSECEKLFEKALNFDISDFIATD